MGKFFGSLIFCLTIFFPSCEVKEIDSDFSVIKIKSSQYSRFFFEEGYYYFEDGEWHSNTDRFCQSGFLDCDCVVYEDKTPDCVASFKISGSNVYIKFLEDSEKKSLNTGSENRIWVYGQKLGENDKPLYIGYITFYTINGKYKGQFSEVPEENPVENPEEKF